MPELEQKAFQKRQVAHKVGICDILKGSFIKDDLSAGYIKLNDFKVSRVNVIAVIVDKSAGNSSAIIDDGTGRILLRSFDDAGFFSGFDVGDVVLTVGRLREFNNERYIVPDIMKKISNGLWMAVRRLELEARNLLNESGKENAKADSGTEVLNETSISERVYSMIKELDSGDGVSFEDILGRLKGAEAETEINRLLENGNIFEIMPGKLKVLE